MRLKFFVVPALDSAAAEAELDRFLARHRVIRAERHLVAQGAGTYWAICIEYLESSALRKDTPSKKGKIDYKEVMAPEDFRRYLALRDLRKTLAEREGVPAYKVFTNEQLATMVLQRIRSQPRLAELAGVGPSRLERYAEPFLQLLQELLPPEDAEADPSRAG